MISMRRSPGYYGKVPALGDFVSRRLPAHFVRPWDLWLQEALSMSREQLGEGWLDIYLTSPIWRFALSPGVCGSEGCAGILMPSVDKVGRYFPLVLAALIEAKEELPWLFFAGDEWFTKLEGLALSALEDEFDQEAFDQELQKLVPALYLPDDKAQACTDLEGKSAKGRFCLIGLDRFGQMRDASVRLNACMLGSFMPVYSLWCTSGSDRVKPSLLAYEGLPPPAVFTEFLAGPGERDEGSSMAVSSASVTRPVREAFNPGSPSAQPGAASPAASSASVTRPVREAFNPGSPSAQPGAASLRWRSFALSNVGNVRKANEDAYLDRPEYGLWVVADGMGGHRSGGAASKAVVEALSAVPADNSLESLVERVKASLYRVNADLIEMARQFGPGDIVGSTVVILLTSGCHCSVVWVGDSRLYRLRHGNLEQITRDHSLVAELSQMGVGNQDELDGNTSISSVLTRALGAEPDLAVDTLSFEAREGDVYLLCSDGLIREVNSDEIAEIMSKKDCEQSSRDLIDLALTRECRDNVTVVVVSAGPG